MLYVGSCFRDRWQFWGLIWLMQMSRTANLHIFEYTQRITAVFNVTQWLKFRSPAKNDTQNCPGLPLPYSVSFFHFPISNLTVIWFHICFCLLFFFHPFISMTVLPVQCVKCVKLRRKAQVALLIEPHSQRVPVGDQEPLPHIKFGAVDQQGPLQVLLHHPLALPHWGWVTIHQPQDLIQALGTFDTWRAGGASQPELWQICELSDSAWLLTSAPGHSTRFYDPDVVYAVYVQLWTDLHQPL